MAAAGPGDLERRIIAMERAVSQLAIRAVPLETRITRLQQRVWGGWYPAEDETNSPGNVTIGVGGPCGSGGPVSGVGVSLSRTGFTTLTGTTNGAGQVSWANVPLGVWTIAITSAPARFAAGSGGAINVHSGSNGLTVTLSPATGYHCLAPAAGKSYPVADTLFLTDRFGTTTLTYNPSSHAWEGSTSVTLNGFITCPSGGPTSITITVSYSFNGATVSVDWRSCFGSNTASPCADTVGLATSCTASSLTLTDPPSFSASGSISASCGLYNGLGSSITVTE